MKRKKARKADPFARLRENPPKQARSRETFNRLLDAAEVLLDEGGLDAATVPAIAKRAGVSVGVVYRRFPDKDNLLRAVYQRFFERTRLANRTGITQAAQLRLPLPRLMRAIIRGAVKGNQLKRNVIRSLITYGRTHRDRSFRRAAIEMNRESMQAVSGLLMAHADEMTHPHTEQAIEFAMVTIAAIMYVTVLEEEPLYTFSKPEAIEEELIRLLLAYLGIDDGEHPAELLDVGRGRLAGVILADKSRR